MKPDYEKKLEAEIDRRLKRLPELPAPLALAGRVMARIDERARLIWYRQPWQHWPLLPRIASFILLASVFAMVCYLADNLPSSRVSLPLGSRAQQALTFLGSLKLALFGWVGQINSNYLIGFGVAVGVSYLLIIGLGVALFRIAWAMPELRKYETQ